jgi:hypothetical protein
LKSKLHKSDFAFETTVWLGLRRKKEKKRKGKQREKEKGRRGKKGEAPNRNSERKSRITKKIKK